MMTCAPVKFFIGLWRVQSCTWDVQKKGIAKTSNICCENQLVTFSSSASKSKILGMKWQQLAPPAQFAGPLPTHSQCLKKQYHRSGQHDQNM